MNVFLHFLWRSVVWVVLSPKKPGCFFVILLMEEILHHLGCMKPYKYWDKLPTSTGAGFQPSTVVYPSDDYSLDQDQEHCCACQLVWQCHCQSLRTATKANDETPEALSCHQCVETWGRLVALSNDYCWCMKSIEILHVVLLYVIYLHCKGKHVDSSHMEYTPEWST